jgi:hypothetical protein
VFHLASRLRIRRAWPCRSLRRPELLNAAIAGVGDVDVAERVAGDARRGAELAVGRAVAAPLGEQFAQDVELLDPVVAGVGDVDAAGGVGRHALGVGKLAVAGALAAPVRYEPAARSEPLNAVVVGVCDVDVIGTGGGDAEASGSGC